MKGMASPSRSESRNAQLGELRHQRFVQDDGIEHLRAFDRECLREIDRLIHLELAVANHLGDVHRAEHHSKSVSRPLDGEHPTHCPARQEKDLAGLNIARALGVGIERPDEPLRTDRADGAGAL